MPTPRDYAPESVPTKRVTGARVEDRWTRKDGTPSARAGLGLRYMARYVGTDGREHSKSFPDKKKKVAEAWLRDQSAAVTRGEWIDPSKSSATVGTVAALWLSGNRSKTAATAASYLAVWTKHVAPRWADVELRAVDHDEVVAWIGGLGSGTAETSERPLSASSVRHCHAVLHQILALAVRSGRLKANPARDVPLPAMPISDKVFLSAAEVEHLGRAADYLASTAADRVRAGKATSENAGWSAMSAPMSANGLVLRVLGLTGLRFGELAGLRVSRVNLATREIKVDRAVAEVGGRLVVGSPKSHKTRTVLIPLVLLQPLRAQMEGQDPDAYVFSSASGEPLRRNNFARRIFAPARKLAGIDGAATLHSLRHSFASIMLTSGIPPMQVQKWMGHHSLTLTADVYGHLFKSETDRAMALLDQAVSPVDLHRE